MEGSLFSNIKKFDAYPKTLEDFRVKTIGGAIGIDDLYHIITSSSCLI